MTISQFYNGRSVFITGGTGFMGKVLVEKLLRSCPGIRNIYLLIRPKRGQDVNARLNELLNSPLFDTIRKEKPLELNKIVPICGDITSEELGISANDQNMLFDAVTVVFHSAATVRFDEDLKLSATINMLGTKRLVKLCHKMKTLAALIHVSTAYCNCDRTEIGEEVYATSYHPDDIISLINWLPEDVLDKVTQSLIGNLPNTYTFTKALAEQILLKEANDLPVAIVRPSIVLCCVEDPTPGWLDNWNGPTGLVSAIGNGIFRTIICNSDYVADVVPVDIVINLMIVAAWRTASTRNASSGIKVYNCVTSKQNPITWSEFIGLSVQNMIKHPLEGVFWYPTFELRTNRVLNFVHGYLVHYIPAYFFDLFARSMGKRPINIKIQNKISKMVNCLEYFTTHQWTWSDTNVQSLHAILGAHDRHIFQLDVNKIDWETFVESYVLGFREFLFKQAPDSLPSTRRRMSKLYIVHQLSKALLVLVAWRMLIVVFAPLLPWINKKFNWFI